MAFVGNFILRFITIGFGLMLALAAAGLFIGFGLYNEVTTTGPLMEQWEEDLFAFVSMGAGLFSTVAIGSFGLGVIAILIALAEMMGWRSIVANLVMGGAAAGFLAMSGFGFINQHGAPIGNGGFAGADESYGPLLVALSAGFIGGFVYWLIAGRRAGVWLDNARREKPVE